MSSLGSLFKSPKSVSGAIGPQPVGFQFNTPAFGLDSGLGPNQAQQTTLTAKGTAPQLAFARRFPRMLDDIDALRAGVRPGFSAFRQAGMGAFAAARSREAGNLRESLARRNVLGSDFAADAASRQAREFAQGEAEFLGQVGLQELEASKALIQFEADTVTQQLLRELQELQVVSGVGLQAAGILQQGASIRAQALNADNAGLIAQQGQALDLIGTLAGFGLNKAFPTPLRIENVGGSTNSFAGFGTNSPKVSFADMDTIRNFGG